MSTCNKPGRESFVHVNMHTFQRNLKTGDNAPAITTKCGSDNHYGYGALVTGPCYIKYSGKGKPLISCGARVAVTSRFPVEVIETFENHPPLGKRFLKILRPVIRQNIHAEELAPVVELHDGDTVTAGYGAMIEGDLVVRQCLIEGDLKLIIETDANVIIDPVPPESS